MDKSTAAKKWLVTTALTYLGTPYVWGGDDPSGFDCSGLALECLKSVGLVPERADLTADQLMKSSILTATNQPTEGALLFTLDDSGKATHVVICLDSWFQIGANGGSRSAVDLTTAWRLNAYVKIRPIRLQPGRYRILLPKY